MSTGTFTDYEELSERQQMEARMTRPRWARDDFRRFAFFVMSDGRVSKRAGHHQLSTEELARIERAAKDIYRGNPAKGDIRHFVTTVFHGSKEQV